MKYTKQCTQCGETFTTSYPRKKRCSEKCADAHHKDFRKSWDAQNKDRIKEYNQKTVSKRQKNGKNKEYRTTRRSTKAGYVDRFLGAARSANPDTDLTRDYIEGIFGDVCSVTGVPFRFTKGNFKHVRNPYAPSIDRIDSSLPYQKGNIQIVLLTVNLAKNDMSMGEFQDVWGSILKSWPALTRGDY